MQNVIKKVIFQVFSLIAAEFISSLGWRKRITKKKETSQHSRAALSAVYDSSIYGAYSLVHFKLFSLLLLL
jgi:hypothetical protein